MLTAKANMKRTYTGLNVQNLQDHHSSTSSWLNPNTYSRKKYLSKILHPTFDPIIYVLPKTRNRIISFT